MSFLKKITKFGNSNGLIIEKRILEMLEIDQDTPLKITTDGVSLVITPVRKTRTIKDILQKNFVKYGETLRELAK